MFAALLAHIPPAHGFLSSVRSRISGDTIGLAEWARRARCGLTGHAMVLYLEPQKMSLRCMDCGEQTSGWAIRARS